MWRTESYRIRASFQGQGAQGLYTSVASVTSSRGSNDQAEADPGSLALGRARRARSIRVGAGAGARVRVRVEVRIRGVVLARVYSPTALVVLVYTLSTILDSFKSRRSPGMYTEARTNNRNKGILSPGPLGPPPPTPTPQLIGHDSPCSSSGKTHEGSRRVPASARSNAAP